MPNTKQDRDRRLSHASVRSKIDEILSGIRIPDLPYPVGKGGPQSETDWRPLLSSCWNEQRDESVARLLRSVSITWTIRQVNAAYVADRIMDVFLKTSGLHPTLAGRIARLRFFLAWRMGLDSSAAFEDSIREWLDGLVEWRGWSDNGGRAARALLDQLDSMVIAVSASFERNSLEPFESFCLQWRKDAENRQQRASKLLERLQETEQGAARQRRAEQTARALVGRALKGRQLPEAVSRFILDYWFGLIRQIVWTSGIDTEEWRHAGKLLEWLVWIGDPTLSDGDRNRLYHVGEQIGDRLADIWQKVYNSPLPEGALTRVEQVLVARLRGETLDLAPALAGDRALDFDSRWLTFTPPDKTQLDAVQGQWFVEGEGDGELRRYFFALLEDSCEVLWTNGAGVKLGLMPWQDFVAAKDSGVLRPLPPLNSFGNVLLETVRSLAVVFDRQRQQREKAAGEAKARAEALRREKEALARKQQEAEAAHQAALAQEKAEAAAKQAADEEAERQRLAREAEAAAYRLVEEIKLGSWIVLEDQSVDDDMSPRRLKLAVRINASRKLVFVDRLGLNRTEFLVDDLVAAVVAGRIRILGSAAEFDETLSRVVGRIRVGRN